jgi:glycosyltransferase involved in cell wall biosynthesis
MTRVMFFTQNRWAFGSLHQGLIKELYKHGVYANLLDYTIGYSQEEFNFFLDTYDYFVTNPESIPPLMSYGVPSQRIVAVAHAEWDIYVAAKDLVHNTTNWWDLHSFGAISDKLVDMFNSLNPHSKVKAQRVTNGINFDAFYAKPSESMRRIGFGGKMVGCNFFGVDIKRGHLVQKVSELVNTDTGFTGIYIDFIPNGTYHYLAMPGYYKSVDALIMASTEEAAGMPMLEAAAAGRLCIGTPVGYFKDNGLKGGGHIVNLNEENFIEETLDILQFYKYNNDAYKKKCLEIQEYARENYDWSKVVDQWIKLF